MTSLVFYTLFPTVVLPAVLSKATRSGRRAPLYVAVTSLVYAAVLAAPIITRTNTFILIIAVIGIVAVNIIIIVSVESAFLGRSITLIVNVLICASVFGLIRWFPYFNDSARALALELVRSNALLRPADASVLGVGLVGVVGAYVATIEANHPIAFILKQSRLMPGEGEAGNASVSPHSTALSGEPARGRAIGYLERLIVYALTVSGNLAALGLVLVAKGIARFRQLDDRDFAEYVLIGTLMSISAAMLVGFAVRPFV